MEDSSKVFAIGNIEQVAVADGTVDARRALPEQSVQVLQADERQRWGGLPLDQQLPDHQQGVPEEALHPASLLFSQCGRQEDGDVHHEEDGGTGGRVETRVCAAESCWSPLDNVISVAGVCQSLTAPRQHRQPGLSGLWGSLRRERSVRGGSSE